MFNRRPAPIPKPVARPELPADAPLNTPRFHDKATYTEMPAEQARQELQRLKADADARELYASGDPATVKRFQDLNEAAYREDDLAFVEPDPVRPTPQQEEARFQLAQLKNNRAFMDVYFDAGNPGHAEYVKHFQDLSAIADGRFVE